VGHRGLDPVADESVQLGLGRIVDRQGRLPAATRRETVAAIADYQERARSLGARSIALLGTEPLRRASNRSALRADVLHVTGLELHVLSHEQEAELTLLGVTGGRHITGTLLVIAIGGGSTQLILAAAGRDPVVGVVPFGSARLSARLVDHDPPTRAELRTLRRAAVELFATMPAGHPTSVIVVGGTGSNLCRLLQGTTEGRLDRASVRQAISMLAASPARTLADRHLLRESRVAQLAAGATMVEAAMERYGVDVIDASDASPREGAVLALEQAGQEWLAQLPMLIRR
jgi:exopolyphosphatase/guanosine-5'-triphosphate,3'-diphosphate pyrophosphatase